MYEYKPNFITASNTPVTIPVNKSNVSNFFGKYNFEITKQKNPNSISTKDYRTARAIEDYYNNVYPYIANNSYGLLDGKDQEMIQEPKIDKLNPDQYKLSISPPWSYRPRTQYTDKLTEDERKKMNEWFKLKDEINPHKVNSFEEEELDYKLWKNNRGA